MNEYLIHEKDKVFELTLNNSDEYQIKDVANRIVQLLNIETPGKRADDFIIRVILKNDKSEGNLLSYLIHPNVNLRTRDVSSVGFESNNLINVPSNYNLYIKIEPFSSKDPATAKVSYRLLN